ncbi:MAG: hypothetical protein ABID54_12940 [Pseudomonadota bacterium]
MEKDGLLNRYGGLRKVWFNLILVTLYMCITGPEVLAHKVNVFAYVEGDTVFTESYFNDGRKCVNSKIEVFDSAGNKLLEGETNKAGEFSFRVPRKTDLRLILTASMGHRAEYTVPASELADTSEGEVEKPKPQPARREMPAAGTTEQKETVSTESTRVDIEQIKSVIEDSLDKKLIPLVKLIAKSREPRVSLTQVIGGIGYIFGIMGIVMYFKSRKR